MEGPSGFPDFRTFAVEKMSGLVNVALDLFFTLQHVLIVVCTLSQVAGIVCRNRTEQMIKWLLCVSSHVRLITRKILLVSAVCVRRSPTKHKAFFVVVFLYSLLCCVSVAASIL